MIRSVVCSVGTSDPWNAAGLGLDILALAECGAYPVTVIAGVTAQDRSGVHAQLPIPAELVRAQLAALADAGIAAYRIGALLDVATVGAVAGHVARDRAPVVYDPALAPSGGGRFGDEDVVAALRERLVPLASIVTPNLTEAAQLTGRRVEDVATMEEAGRALVAMGAHAALVKGGHLGRSACDVLVDDDGTRLYEARRLPGTLRGTGCLLAAALAAELARRTPLREAVATAREFVREKLANGHERGRMQLAY